jgi:hypothetical protein
MWHILSLHFRAKVVLAHKR